MSFSVIIPARLGATRLPGKPLLDIAGKPMIQHVFERARESGAQQVIIATDSAEIEAAAQQFGAQSFLTSVDHQSGTDRIAEVAEKLSLAEDHIVVNLQGDEPLMPAAVIHQVAENLAACPAASMSTVCTPITTTAELFDPHVVKVVKDEQGLALYFSRASIPWDREAFANTAEVMPDNAVHFRHIGLYAYRAGFLRAYSQWSPCPLEQTESLEQLRALWHGHRIHVAEAIEVPQAGVDTERDLDVVRAVLAAQ
jgi:3-deoxy-manno-octulosonate cytidylyltransferase (CMP-KDO synthetase)